MSDTPDTAAIGACLACVLALAEEAAQAAKAAADKTVVTDAERHCAVTATACVREFLASLPLEDVPSAKKWLPRNLKPRRASVGIAARLVIQAAIDEVKREPDGPSLRRPGYRTPKSE